ncbi:MAG: SLBB domain-containing protein [Candidatus Krumholzibacteriota bacterium]|nr:SLBB domain-containing protein [Candidatus Krumholzibacteriota bacterium]
MKKAFSFISIILFLFAGVSLSAQEPVNPENFPDSVKQKLDNLPKDKRQKLIEEQKGKDQPKKVKNDSLDQVPPETDFEKYGYYTDIGEVFSSLPVFGNAVFRKGSGSFSNAGSFSVPEDYILGPGDKITLNIWGKREESFTLKINYEGNVFIPQIGAVNLRGRTLSDSKKLLKNKISKTYSDSNVYLSLSNPKLIYLSVNGEANNPGQFNLPPVSNIIQAISYAGGISDKGSMRNIHLVRNKKVISIDIYPFLLSGDWENRILSPNDVIYIPMAEKKVAILGNVKRNAVYELKDNEGLKELIEFSGGFTADADPGRIQIDRIIKAQERITGMPEREILNVDYEALKKKNTNFILQNSDVVTVFQVSGLINNYVKIRGAVFKPGTYSIKSAMSLNELITKAGGIFDDAYRKRCDILRTYPDSTKEIYDVNLAEIVKENINFELQKLDEVTIYSVLDFKDTLSVSISGAVRKPGEYLFTEDMNLEDLVTGGGGFKYSADSTWVEISRLREITPKSDTLWNVFRVDLKDNNEQFPLQEFDRVYVREQPEFRLQETVTIEGEVKYPGKYSLITDNDNIFTLIERAGGFTDRAFEKGIMLLRPSLRRNFSDEEIRGIINNAYEMEQDTTSAVVEFAKKYGVVKFNDINFQRINVDFEEVLDDEREVTLKNADIINVPEKTDEVFVLGAVPRNGTYKVKKGEDYKYYIKSAGGLNENADDEKISILKYNGLVYSEDLGDVPIESGDYIIIPKELKKPSTLWKDLNNIFSVVGTIVTSTYIIYQISQ